MSIDYSISLEKQPTWTIYNESPSAETLSARNLVVDNSWYEEYSYTGKQAEIEAQKNRELNAADSSLQVQATMTRLNRQFMGVEGSPQPRPTRNRGGRGYYRRRTTGSGE